MSILQDIYDYIKTGETDTENFGLEIEHFILDTVIQISVHMNLGISEAFTSDSIKFVADMVHTGHLCTVFCGFYC